MTNIPALVVSWFAKILIVLSCAIMLLMALHVTVDVVWRAVFNHPIPGTLEVGTHYYMIAVSFLGLAYVQMKDGHVAVEFIVHSLKKRLRMVLEFSALLICFIFSAFYLYYSWISAGQKTRIGEYVLVHGDVMKIWPSRWILVVSVAAFTLVLAVQLVRLGRALWLGRLVTVADLMEAEVKGQTGEQK